jgi:hypothetical protein
MRSTLSLTIAGIIIAAGTAWAARPANLARTSWVVQVNGDTEVLNITAQGGPGAPGAATCQSIRGDIRTVADIRGWYCPSTGRVFFVHSNVDSGVAVRIFSGHVSDVAEGRPLHMAGTVAVVNSAFGDLGEYNFSATQ